MLVEDKIMRFANREKIKQLLNKKAILVDMRSPIQFRDNPIPGAVNYPLNVLPNKLILEKDKTKPVIVFATNSRDRDVEMGIKYSENLGFESYVTSLKELENK